MWLQAWRPEEVCITSKVNSIPVSRVRVRKRRCNREKPRFILLKFLQFLNFPQLFVLSLN